MRSHPPELPFPCGAFLFEPPSSKLCCMEREALGDGRVPAARALPAATAQTAHPDSDGITNLARRELLLLAA